MPTVDPAQRDEGDTPDDEQDSYRGRHRDPRLGAVLGRPADIDSDF